MPLVTGRKPSQHPDPSVAIDQDAYLIIETADGIVCRINLDSGALVTDQVFNIDGNNIAGGSSLNTIINALNSAIGNAGGGGGLLKYQATPVNDPTDNGAFLTSTIAGVTYERAGGSGQNTEGILTVPNTGIMRGLAVHFTGGQAPGNTFYLNVDYTGTGKLVDGSQDSIMPVTASVVSKPTTFSDASPATNFVHAGTPLQVGVAQVNDNGTRVRIRYKISNYNQQVGANASILMVVFP